MKIGIHITTCNRKKLTDHCLKSLFWSNPKNCKLVIVDNNSSDGTKDFLKELKNPMIKKIIYNNENKHLGYAVNQGWNALKDSCDILGWINNDFLFEPGWDKNLIECVTSLNLDYVVGMVNLTSKQKIKTSSPQLTLNKKGSFIFSDNVGAAYFLLSKHFKKGIAPITDAWYKGYTGPGSRFHRLLQEKNFKGVRLLSPGILLGNSEYNLKEYENYYDQTFSIRGISENLSIKRSKEKNGEISGITWEEFLNKYYLNYIDKFKNN